MNYGHYLKGLPQTGVLDMKRSIADYQSPECPAPQQVVGTTGFAHAIRLFQGSVPAQPEDIISYMVLLTLFSINDGRGGSHHRKANLRPSPQT